MELRRALSLQYDYRAIVSGVVALFWLFHQLLVIERAITWIEIGQDS